MEVAKATFNVINSGKYALRLVYLTTLFIMPIGGRKVIPDCPDICRCFPIVINDMFDPPTFSRASEGTNNTLTASSCQRQQLTSVPSGFARDTAVLFLSFNQLTHLNRSMFAGLNMLQILDISHNNLISIANDTFDGMPRLKQLDITFNQIRRLPKGFLCPWYKRGFVSDEVEIGCNGWITAQTKLQLAMSQNPWHCNCRLQEFVELFSCAFDQPPCIQFSASKHDPVGHCVSPLNLKGIPLTRLSSFEGRKELINVCKNRSGSVDIPLLVTIFTWMGAVLGYVIYFVSWNHREVANHRSYLSTLNFQTESTTRGPRTRSTDRPCTTTVDSVFERNSRCNARARRECLELKTIRKEPPKVEIIAPTSPDIWVERSDSDVACESDDTHHQLNPHYIEVQPYQPTNEIQSSISEPCYVTSEDTEPDRYCMSSL